MSRRTRRSRRRPLLALVTLLLAAGAFVLWARSGDPAPAAAGTAPSATSAAAPSTVAPTEDPDDGAEAPDAGAEAAADEDEADEEPTRPTATTTPPETEEEDGGDLAAVAVSLSYTGYDAAARAVVAGGYAAGVVEEDATCTLVLRRDGVELYDESLGAPDVTTTDCGELRVAGDALTSGTWEAVLSYTSETSVGESAALEVMVP